MASADASISASGLTAFEFKDAVKVSGRQAAIFWRQFEKPEPNQVWVYTGEGRVSWTQDTWEMYRGQATWGARRAFR